MPFVRGTFRECCRENCVAKHIMLACGRIRRKRYGRSVRHASRGEEGVHLMLANPPWHQLRGRAEKIQGGQKHGCKLGEFSHKVTRSRSSLQHRKVLTSGELSQKRKDARPSARQLKSYQCGAGEWCLSLRQCARSMGCAEDLDPAAFQGNLAARAASKRSNCKGPPGLPCAVTPQGTWPPWVPSNPSTIMTILRTGVCPVVDNCGVRQKRTFGRHVLAEQSRCGPKSDGYSVACKINISALGISPDQLYAQLVSNICSLLSLPNKRGSTAS